MMGNGLFALGLKIIFLNNVSTIRYHGDESTAGRREARYDFFVPHVVGALLVHNAGASGVVGMRGSFWADLETYDLLRLEYHADEIPPDLLYADIFTTIYYDRVRIGDRDVLLPQAADLRTIQVNGEEKWNHIEFTHCQGFHTEGTLPLGLRITVALSAPLDDHAPVG